MSDGYFKVSSIKNLDELQLGDQLSTSDFATLTKEGKFLQLEYIEEDTKIEKYKVKPGIYSIISTISGLKLESTSFTSDKVLTNNKYVEQITKQINSFFSRCHDIYTKYDRKDVPKRGWLFWGPPGCGKSTIIKEVVAKYNNLNDAAIILWPSDKIDPYEVKSFIKKFLYVDVNKLILVIEDLGGVEIDQVRIKSMSSLLSLLDNVEATFTISTAVLATTNFPENFLGNITNRPQRFDRKIEFALPTGEERAQFLEFFSNNTADENVKNELKLKKYSKITPAHIKDIPMRADLDEISMLEALKAIQKEIEVYERDFNTTKQKLGISEVEYDE